MKKSNKWFSIIEILVWIFIFSIWFMSIFFLILHTMNLNIYSKNSIVASNLSREGIELVRNIRDSNYNNLYKWNKLPWTSFTDTFQTWTYYKIENDYTSSDYDVKIEKISDFWEWKIFLSTKMKNYKLCLNSNNNYTYDCSLNNKETYFYRYIKFDEVVYKSGSTDFVVPDALKLTSKAIWYNKWYHEVELKTIITDFQRQ